MTIREVTALVLLYRACPDRAVRRRVLTMIPELGEVVHVLTDAPANDAVPVLVE